MSTNTTTSAARSVSRSVTCRLPGADRPVDRAELVTGQVGADVGELDTGTEVPSQVRASRSGSSVRGIPVGCGGTTGKT